MKKGLILLGLCILIAFSSWAWAQDIVLMHDKGVFLTGKPFTKNVAQKEIEYLCPHSISGNRRFMSAAEQLYNQ